jgi:UDP-2,4-diacetamido-2,4,6-trideoxy-beta-L-altropyranose hydrolase
MKREGLEPAEPTLRLVGEGDMRRLWEWSNDPDVRQQSFDQSPIEWADHVSWFTARQQDPQSSMYVIEFPLGVPVGVVRFQRDGESSAIVSIAIDAALRGGGLGSTAIRQACAHMRDEVGVSRIYAFIKPDNAPSIAAFGRAGFKSTTERSHEGAVALEWEDRRE